MRETPKEREFAVQGLRNLWPAVHLAEKVGESLGGSPLLFGSLPWQQT